MNYTKLNKYLADLEALRNTKPVKRDVLSTNENEIQGVEGVINEVYEVDGFFLKLTIKTDSYNDNERVTGIEFVQPIEKVITTFESL